MRILGALFFGLLLWATSARFTLAQETPLQDDTGRKILSKTVPMYPELARKMNLEGVVKLRVTVAPNSTVKYMETLGGSPVIGEGCGKCNLQMAMGSGERRIQRACGDEIPPG